MSIKLVGRGLAREVVLDVLEEAKPEACEEELAVDPWHNALQE